MMTDHCAMLLVRAMAIQARIESMKVENAAWAAGGQSPCYGESDFLGYAKDLDGISESMQ